MNEIQIRSDIKAQLPRCIRNASSARLVEEMEICSGKARADMAVITDRLIGIEIKSPQDNLSRLPLQVPQYSRCFDQVVLVVDEILAEKALLLIPRWWGVFVGTDRNGASSYDLKRRPSQNSCVEVESVLALLWRQEIEAVFAKFLGLEPPKRASKRKLREQLLAGIPHLVLKAAGIDMLRQRQNWRSAPIV